MLNGEVGLNSSFKAPGVATFDYSTAFCSSENIIFVFLYKLFAKEQKTKYT